MFGDPLLFPVRLIGAAEPEIAARQQAVGGAFVVVVGPAEVESLFGFLDGVLGIACAIVKLGLLEMGGAEIGSACEGFVHEPFGFRVFAVTGEEANVLQSGNRVVVGLAAVNFMSTYIRLASSVFLVKPVLTHSEQRFDLKQREIV